MNVIFNGYLSFVCNDCHKIFTVESQEFKFEQDSSTEAEEDNYIRYVADISRACAHCATEISIKVDVWEHPEAVANYSYHSVQGAHDIQCEFNIEHYFDDESGLDSGGSWGSVVEENVENSDEYDADVDGEEGSSFNDDLAENDNYIDHYDNDDS